MKKTLLPLIFSVLVVANAAAGTIYTDIENYITPSSLMGFQVKPGSALTGEFDLTSDGYSSAIEHVYGGLVTFGLWDPKFGSESVSMTFGSSSSAIWSGSVSIAMAVGGIVDGPALWDLSVDGKLKFVISSAFGEAYVTSATIIAYAGAPGVPDGGYTLTLLGLAFLGILGAHRKFTLAHC